MISIVGRFKHESLDSQGEKSSQGDQEPASGGDAGKKWVVGGCSVS